MIGRKQGRLIGTHSPNLAERNEPTPNFSHLAALGILCVRSPVSNFNLRPINGGGDGLVRANAFFFLGVKREPREEQEREDARADF